jgi:hypothetical protein
LKDDKIYKITSLQLLIAVAGYTGSQLIDDARQYS